MDSSTISSLDKGYDDGVFDKIESQLGHASPRTPVEKPPRLPLVMLVCLVVLLVVCFVGILISGLFFAHRLIDTGDCLGQSWIMFSSILGFLYIGLHLQAARKGEPVNRAQPPSQHPLHCSTIVIARLDTIAWMVSLIIISVAVSKEPSIVSCLNLAVCTAVTPVITLILCVTEKAVCPFDLPYITKNSSISNPVACHPSALMDTMPEVTTDDSISRRGSSHSNRPNSHVQHAAAVAASNPTNTAPISGPRPLPPTAKEARPWAFTNFDNRTKTELAASVDEASHASDTRVRIGGPRPLADSPIAIRRGVLAPPICSDPKVVRPPERKATKEESPKEGSGGSGGWKKDWTTLATVTGWVTPANSASGTPASTPGAAGSRSGSFTRMANRCLSPVVEVDDKRASVASLGDRLSTATTPKSQAQSLSQPSPPSAAASPSRLRSAMGPRSPASSSYTHSTQASERPREVHYFDSTGVLKPPPSIGGTPRSQSPARVRLIRAQEALKTHRDGSQPQGRSSTDTISLRRPQRLTGERRGSGEDSQAGNSIDQPGLARMPGSWD